MTATLEPAATGRVRAADLSRISAPVAAVSLVLGAAGNTAQAVLNQMYGGRPETVEAQIALANAHPTWALTMCIVGTVAVPFMAVGFLAASQALRRRARRTGTTAAVLLTLGMWGFLAMQIGELIQMTAMLDDKGREAAIYLQHMHESVVLNGLFGIPFFAGAVLGMLTLTIGLLVKGGLPRWIPGAWLAFIVLDFTVGRVGPVDPHWLYLAGAVGLAVHLLRGRGRAVA